MSTSQYFFYKAFNKSDSVEANYNNYDFNKLSENEKQFLKNLTIFSKYKLKLQKRLLKDNTLSYKLTYLELHGDALEYEGYIQYQRALEGYLYVLKSSAYLFIPFLIGLTFFRIAVKPVGYSFNKDIVKNCLIISAGTASYIMYYRAYHLKPQIDNIFKALSSKLNNCEGITPTTQDSRKNYFSF